MQAVDFTHGQSFGEAHHVVVDNYATHKHPGVKRWLAARPRFHVHFTPTYASWLNQVEIWFNRITQQAIRRGTFRSVKHSEFTSLHSVHVIQQNHDPTNRKRGEFVSEFLKLILL